MLRSLLREGSRFPATVEVSMLVVALSAMAGLATAQDDETGPRLDGLKRLDLPQEIARASDVRWLADGEIVLGVIGSGIHAWRLGEKGAELRVALEDPAPEVLEIGGRAVVNRNTFERDYGLLGSSPQGLAFADLFGGVFLANDSGIDGPVDIKFLGDLDRRGALTAAVGLMLRDADGWAPYAAWLIADGGGSPRGLLPTRDGGRGLELCRDAELSVIRFISEDRLLVIPGAEAGIFVYDVDGSIHDSLDAATFFAETGCDVEPNEWGNSPLNDAYARADWLSPRRVIDEVVADGAGNCVSWIHSLSNGFGSGFVAGGTGVLFNNRAGRGFSLQEGHPNVFDPGKRTMHTLNCYMAFQDGEPVIVGGTPGGDYQPQCGLQVLANLINYDMDPQAAVEAPRWWSFPGTDPATIKTPLELKLERGMPESVRQALESLGHRVAWRQQGVTDGIVQLIVREPETGVLKGASDPRGDGHAAAW